MATRGRRSRGRAFTLSEAQQRCLEHALRHHNRGLKRIADLVGKKYDTLHNYLANDSMPIALIGAFEHACGATYLTEFLCAQAHLLAVEMPTGRKLQESDVMALQASFSDAMGLLIRFYQGEADQESTLSALDALMSEIGWQRANVERAKSPELPLFGGSL